ncbi:MAG: phosphatidylglycerophosphatase A [Magnetococcales bacterium]|nr:phosphatidylglycerophosphatase A [Magnetococcales bacterium]
MLKREKLALFIATLGGVGTLRRAPGTFGTLATIPLCYGLISLGMTAHLVGFVFVTMAGTWAAEVAGRVLGQKDPSAVVIDESAGILLTYVGIPLEWTWLLAGFVLFRLFDIWKPWPVGWLDQTVDGGVGVMADDLAAGAYALLILQFFYWWMG